MKTVKNIVLIIFFLFLELHGQERAIKFVDKTQYKFEADFDVVDADYASGYFYLTSNRNNQILIYDEKGEQIKSIGRSGQGPGEFGQYSPTSIIVMKDRIIVSDPGNLRIQIFDLNGNFLKQYKVMSEIPLQILQALYSFDDKKEIGLYGLFLKESKGAVMNLGHRLVAFEIEAGSCRTIYEGDYATLDVSKMKAINPFSAFPSPVVNDNLVFQAERDLYRIYLFDFEGNKKQEITRESRAIPFNDRLKSYFSEKDEFRKVKELSQGMIDFSFPSHLPIIKKIFVLDGNLFVWTWESWYRKNFEKPEEDYKLDIFDLKGDYLGRASFSLNPEEIIKIKSRKAIVLKPEGDKKIIELKEIIRQ